MVDRWRIPAEAPAPVSCDLARIPQESAPRRSRTAGNGPLDADGSGCADHRSASTYFGGVAGGGIRLSLGRSCSRARSDQKGHRVSARRLILLAILPGLLLPGSLAFQLCFCGLFKAPAAHAGCPHEEQCARQHGPALPQDGSSCVLRERGGESCYCVQVSLPEPPPGDRVAERTPADSAFDAVGAIAPAAVTPLPAPAPVIWTWHTPGRDRSPLPWSSRTLPLLI
jgi:hypothetical protein